MTLSVILSHCLSYCLSPSVNTVYIQSRRFLSWCSNESHLMSTDVITRHYMAYRTGSREGDGERLRGYPGSRSRGRLAVRKPKSPAAGGHCIGSPHHKQTPQPSALRHCVQCACSSCPVELHKTCTPWDLPWQVGERSFLGRQGVRCRRRCSAKDLRSISDVGGVVGVARSFAGATLACRHHAVCPLLHLSGDRSCRGDAVYLRWLWGLSRRVLLTDTPSGGVS
jgi:hypothetical protein